MANNLRIAVDWGVLGASSRDLAAHRGYYWTTIDRHQEIAMSEGHVFHPGHDELHGQTVVIYTTGSRTFAGRWDAEQGDFIRMVGCTFHDSSDNEKDRDTWVADTKKFGVPTEYPFLMVPKGEVDRVVKLFDA